MNKEVIHSGAFLSRAGVAWKIKIWRMTTDIPVGDDDPDDLEFPAEEPIVIEWDEKAKEEPLCGSCATVRIISPGDRTYAGLYTIEAGSIGCDIYRKGRSDNDYTRYWSGTLDTEQYEEPYERAWGYDVVLTFQDFGIFGRLKYDLEGMQTLQSILTDALQRARLDHVTLDASTYISSRHIEMEQASAVASSEMDYGEGILITDDKPTKWVVGELVPTIDPYLEPIIVGPDTVAANSCNFYDDDGEGLPIADVLTAIMQPFGLRMTQRAGKIWLYDLNALAATPDEITCSTTASNPTGVTVYEGRYYKENGLQDYVSSELSSSYMAVIIPADKFPMVLGNVSNPHSITGCWLGIAVDASNRYMGKIANFTAGVVAEYLDGDTLTLGALPTGTVKVIINTNKILSRNRVVVSRGNVFAPIYWSADAQTMTVDSVYNAIRLNYDPNAEGTLLDDDEVEFTDDADPTKENTNHNSVPSDGTYFTYYSTYESHQSGSYEDWTDRSFTIFKGAGKGLAYIHDASSFFEMVGLLGGSDATGILGYFYTGHGRLRDSSVTNTKYGSEPTSGVLFRTRRVYLPPIDSATANSQRWRIRLKMEMMLDRRYNPFEGIGKYNETSCQEFLEDNANYVFVPADVTLWDAPTGGNVKAYYYNRDIAILHERGNDAPDITLGTKTGKWVTGSAPNGPLDARCWLAWYDNSETTSRKNTTGVGGWQGNRHQMGSVNGKILKAMSEMPDGEYIPYPADGGWLDITIWGGVYVCLDPEMTSNSPATLEPGAPGSGLPGLPDGFPLQSAFFANDGSDPYEARWLLYKHPVLDIVKPGAKYETADAEEIEIKESINEAAAEPLEIDLSCGTADRPAPANRGQLYRRTGDGYIPLSKITRAGNTDSPARLLISTLTAQYDSRHTVLQGESAIFAGGVQCFTDAHQEGRAFMLLGESQNLIEDVSDTTFCEVSPDGGNDTVTYSVTRILDGVTSNAPSTVEEGSSLSVLLTGVGSNKVQENSVVVSMGGVDITSTAYNHATRTISIASVTGDVSITAIGRPYDAEVEYLESSGTQYIDTSIIPTNTYTFDTKIATIRSSYNCVFWGVRSSGTYSSTGQQCYMNHNATASTSAGKKVHLYSTATSSSKNWVGDNMVVNQMYDYRGIYCADEMTQMTYSIVLFGWCNLGTKTSSYCRIGGFTAYNNGAKVMDLIPVRKDGVGYMYDKVSGQLFGNASGSGAFTYGNDI